MNVAVRGESVLNVAVHVECLLNVAACGDVTRALVCGLFPVNAPDKTGTCPNTKLNLCTLT